MSSTMRMIIHEVMETEGRANIDDEVEFMVGIGVEEFVPLLYAQGFLI